jgi:hypothetical protein
MTHYVNGAEWREGAGWPDRIESEVWRGAGAAAGAAQGLRRCKKEGNKVNKLDLIG